MKGHDVVVKSSFIFSLRDFSLSVEGFMILRDIWKEEFPHALLCRRKHPKFLEILLVLTQKISEFDHEQQEQVGVM